MASRALPRLRRRRRLLGAGGDDAHARARSSRTRSEDAVAKLREAVEQIVTDAEERAWSSRASSTCSGSPSTGRARPGGPLLRLAALLRADGRPGPVVMVFEDIHWATLRWSSSSSTCSTGRARTRSSSSRSPARSSPSGTRVRRGAAQLDDAVLEPLDRRGDGRAAAGLVPGHRREASWRDPRPRRRDPALRRRDGAHAARPRAARAGRGYRVVGTSARSRCRRRCTRSSPRGSTVSSRGAARAPGRGRARQDLRRPARRGRGRDRGGDRAGS